MPCSKARVRKLKSQGTRLKPPVRKSKGGVEAIKLRVK